ncbi:MAG: flagellar motor switch protein FliG [Ignavibacteriae bacterium HGW-Ignavibacteriae-2]|jgi:flagellar motor switch protein FliG|nr:flagellar motor switch protein FliG [Bacteroidota bacterium]PKL87416.1 MAG: flagellar motor switch protein FliG [Ignavibacteriae bacterium HGW-Ignavibacteriae-2]
MATTDKLSEVKLNELTGIQKTSLLMIALDVDTAAEVFKYLEPADVETISAEITQVRNTPSNTVDIVLREFHSMVTAREYMMEGGIDYAQSVLEKSFGYNKAIEIIEKVKNLTTLRGFDVLKRADSTQLLNFLNKEHPQTIALILTHLSPEQTANALEELPKDLRTEVAYRIATLGKISPQTLIRIEKVVDEMAALTMSQSVGKIGGTKSLAQILNRTKVSFSKEVLDELMEFNPDVGVEVKRQMFLFDDLINLQDRDMQKLLREIDRKDLTFALKVADEKLKEKIFGNMSERATDLLKEELEYMGMVKLKEVESAQSRIIDIVKSLEESGEISLNLRGGTADDIYV